MFFNLGGWGTKGSDLDAGARPAVKREASGELQVFVR
jgi:hypothetical protein